MGNMCPDRQILSIYFDRELDSPWKEKFEAHLETCPECRTALERYGRTREFLDRDFAVPEAALHRTWEKIAPLAGRDFRYRPSIIKGIWHHSFTVPFPAAAAAGLVLAVIVTLLVVLLPARDSEPQLAGAGIQSGIQGPPVADMASLLQYLNSDNSPDMVIINLPETTFNSAAPPQMLRAADYSRSSRSR